MSYYYLFKEENLTEDQKQRLYDLIMELGPRNDVCYRDHIAEIKTESSRTGFIAGVEAHKKFNIFSNSELNWYADQYADTIKSMETK